MHLFRILYNHTILIFCKSWQEGPEIPRSEAQRPTRPTCKNQIPHCPKKKKVNLKNSYTKVYYFIRNCWTEMLARSLGHIIILVHFRSKR
jgi:hypothetical protein